MTLARAIRPQFLFAFLLLLPATAFANPAGRFLGTTDFGGGTLPTELRFSQADDDGKWSGLISQPAGGLPHMPLTSVTVDGNNVVAVLELEQFMLTCTCTLGDDGNTLTGKMVVRGRNAEYAMSLTRTPMPIDVPGHRIMKGTIQVQGTDVGFSVVFAKTGAGAWLGTMDVPMQAVKDMTLTNVQIGEADDLAVHFEVLMSAQARQTFDGKRSADGKTISGDTAINGNPIGSFSLTATETQPGRNRPQTPKGPFPYRSEQLTWNALESQGGFTLAGTLTIPEGDGPFPCVVLINGSGLHDRDCAIMGHKPFLVVADHMSRRGVAVLRYDERSVGESGGDASNATSEDLADDVVAALTMLATHKLIDPKRMGVAGHSEGSTIAAITAAKQPGMVSFVLLLAGPGQAGREIVPAQLERILTAQGAPAEEIDSLIRYKRDVLAAALDEKLTGPALRMRALSALSAHYSRCPDEAPSDEELMQAVDAEVQGLNNAWVRFFFEFDPRDALARVKCPVLAINGTKDVQVPWDMCLPAIFEALVAGGNTDVTIRALPELNHLFQHATSGLVSEYSEIEETWAPQALQLMTDWILARTAAGRSGD